MLSPPFAFLIFPLLLLPLATCNHQSPVATSSPSTSNGTTVYDLLSQYGLPPGLLPDTVTSFSFSEEDGKFEVNLSGSCYVEFEYLVYYEPKITGVVRYGIVSQLKGIQVQRFLLWLSVDAIKVDLPSSQYIYFDVGWVTKKLNADQFMTVHSCRSNGLIDSHRGVTKQDDPKSPMAILMQAKNMELSNKAATAPKIPGNRNYIHETSNTDIILIDASWDVSHKAGTAMAVFDEEGSLYHIQYKHEPSLDPFQAETLALKEALQLVTVTFTQKNFTIFSDCKILVEAAYTGYNDDISSWRSLEEVAQCTHTLVSNSTRISLKHITREALNLPHQLSNWARRTGNSFTGNPSSCNIHSQHLQLPALFNLGQQSYAM